MWIEQADGSCHVPGIEPDDHELIQSWDLAFKGENTSDYVLAKSDCASATPRTCSTSFAGG